MQKLVIFTKNEVFAKYLILFCKTLIKLYKNID